MEVCILDLGSIRLYSDMLLLTAKQKLIDVPVWSVLIKHEKGNLLFDLGSMENAMEDGRTEADKKSIPWTHSKNQTMIEQLKAAGLSPKDVDTVVVSRLHSDHLAI